MYSIILFSGLVKNLCIGARISLGSSHIALLRVIFSIIPFIPIIQWESLYNSIAYEMIGIDAIESIASPSSSSSSSIKKKIKNIDITNYNDIKDIKIDRNTSYSLDLVVYCENEEVLFKTFVNFSEILRHVEENCGR